MTNSNERIVVLVDMDCFFCQVEVKLQPNLKGKPLAVVQYTQWQSGGIIAVNYEARDHGVSRHMRAEEAKKKCPNLVLATVPGVRGKPDTSRYRIAGREVLDVLRKHSNITERASIDEAYLDITELVNQEMANDDQPSLSEMIKRLPNTFVIGYSADGDNDEVVRSEAIKNWITTTYGELGDVQSQRLVVAGTIVERIRRDVYETTGYRCSAGVSYNKILAKLACGLHKPNKQTILPSAGVPSLYQTLPVKKVRNLGGKFGDVVIESLGCNVMADLLSYSLQDLQTRFDDKTGLWLYNIVRGNNDEPVTTRLISKSIGTCKNFPGKQAIVTKESLEHWVKQLSLEMNERLDQDIEENNRKATLLTISYHYSKDGKIVNQSRSCRLTSNKSETIMKNGLDILSKFAKHRIVFMGMSASKFIEIDKKGICFKNFFTSNSDSTVVPKELSANAITENSGIQLSNTSSAIVGIDDESDISINAKTFTAFDEADPGTVSICDKENANSTSNCTIKSDKTQEITSPMALLKTENKKLKPDNFKKSFFMNILNVNKNNSSNGTLEATVKDGDATVKDKKDAVFYKYMSAGKAHLCKASCSDVNSVPQVQDVNNDDCTANEGVNIVHNLINDREGADPVLATKHTIAKTDSDFPVHNITEATMETYDNNTIKLLDIFPDLNNLDESIVSVLPPRLQREANLILQSRKIKGPKTKVKDSKSGQQKSGEQKRSRSKPTLVTMTKIDTFFNNETKSIHNSNEIALTEKCPDCDKVIPLAHYLEHVDFHVAKKLSQEINKSLPRGLNPATPERNISNLSKAAAKRKRTKLETREPEKRSKSIAAFFS